MTKIYIRFTVLSITLPKGLVKFFSQQGVVKVDAFEPQSKESAKTLVISQLSRARKGGDSALAFFRTAETIMKKWEISSSEIEANDLPDLRVRLIREGNMTEMRALRSSQRGYFNSISNVARFEERLQRVALASVKGTISIEEVKAEIGPEIFPILESMISEIKESVALEMDTAQAVAR